MKQQVTHMNAARFDTLKMAQRLEAAGFPHQQARAAAEAPTDALIEADFATKADIRALRTELRAGTSPRGPALSDIGSRFSMTAQQVGHDIAFRFGIMLTVAVGVLLAAIRYLPPHP